jgi:hypothetical protein
MILNCCKTKKQETNASASIVDGKLVLSLPDALSPVVWQMDLAQAKASALEVLHNEETGQHSLSLKTPKGEKLEVAVFSERAHAVEGLMAASNALKNAHGQIRPHSNDTQTHPAPAANMPGAPKRSAPTHPRNTGKRIMGTILALAVLFIMFTIWSSVMPRPVTTGGGPTATGATATNPQDASGVPVSADAFLRGQ